MSKKPYDTGYSAISIPFYENSIKMERDELERFCNERNLPLFHIRVNKLIEFGIAQSCPPHLEYFTFYEGHTITAIENPQKEPQEAKA